FPGLEIAGAEERSVGGSYVEASVGMGSQAGHAFSVEALGQELPGVGFLPRRNHAHSIVRADTQDQAHAPPLWGSQGLSLQGVLCADCRAFRRLPSNRGACVTYSLWTREPRAARPFCWIAT